jgi:hypothetical protein
MPVNLSELFDPNDTSALAEEDENEGGSTPMTPEQKKALCERLNLPEGTSDEALYGALLVSTGSASVPAPPEKTPEQIKAEEDAEAERKRLAEQQNPNPPAPPVNHISVDDPELKALAEHNPSVAALVEHIKAQDKQLETTSEAIKLAEVHRTVDGLKDKAKLKGYALSPAIEEQLTAALVLSENKAVTEKFVKVLDELVDTGFVFVKLGEIGGGHFNGDTDDAIAQFNREVKKLTDSDAKMTYADAVNQVAATNPELFTAYRDASYSFKE